ncbi:DEAD/DEAH box helicase [Actinomyces procaprae]|uniref:DEAD/DEAH box helicase n=1 Tax=Actinomyces procaprae TaxID=2560010 RepID=UPI00109DCA1A|nr:DEAD/DEAH box helicase [Actinomyces procaprae]
MPPTLPAAFAPATRAWFDAAFPTGPTPVQRRAWEAIGRGENALVIAPTGSGKTLAAFLSAIDHLSRPVAQMAQGGEPAPGDAAPAGAIPADRRPAQQPRGRGARVLYISPLKALGADVERNLRRPLAGITAAAAELGVPAAPIAVGMRTGDTTPAERRRLRTSPPDILITTPESLYLMLTSAVRETLRTVETVIVDEIHSFAGQKRGTHLALSLERLDDLLPRPAQRIGLSATVRPPEEIARFLGGPHPVGIIADDAAHATPDVTVAVPVTDMARVPATLDRHERAMRGAHGRGGPGGGAGIGRGPGGGVRAGGTRPDGPTGAAGGRGSRQTWRSDRSLRAAMAGEIAGTGGSAGAGAPARMTASIWPHIEHALLQQVLTHRTTLIFVNSRGVCERLTAHLNEAYAAHLAERGAASAPVAARAGDRATAADRSAAAAPVDLPPSIPEPVRHHESWEMGASQHTQPLPADAPVIAKAHHGSVSKEQRRLVEEELKSGELRCVVATASLELGIDMGSIDLVLQVAPPPSVAAGLQRVGRAEHRVGGRPRGVIYPIERTQLVDAVVVAEGMRTGSIEHTALVSNALDVLAQQTVAAVAVEDRTADDWYATVTRAAPYRDLPRTAFDSVLELLAGGYASADLSDFSPRIIWDRSTGALTARPNAQRLAVAASGTIPDRGMFPVMLPEGDAAAGRRRVGELDEEMVNESSVGDVITLGTASWRIREIGADRVVVDPAPGRSARLPFWRGEGAGRLAATGAAKGAFLRHAAAALGDGGFGDPPQPELTDRLRRAGMDAGAQANLVALLREQRAATGVVPSDTDLVLERCRDEADNWRLILHSPLGRRVHEPWAMAIKERARRMLGIDPQIVTADDGILLQTPPTEQPPGAELFVFDAAELEQLVRTRVDQTAVFAARFRECAARALLMPSARPGRRTPLWLQRLKAGQLQEASRRFPSFPVAMEAARECLQDVWDLPALRALMERLAAGDARVVEAVTQVPSPFAGPLLFGYTSTFLYQYDLPHAERRAQLLSLDPDAVAELVGDGGIADLLDEEVMAQVESELQHLAPGRQARADAEGLSDLLRELGPLSAGELAARCRGDDGAGISAGLTALERARRAFPVRVGGRECWARAEDAAALRDALGVQVPDWAVRPAVTTSPAPVESAAGQAESGVESPAVGVAGILGAPAVAAEASAPRGALADLVLRHARTHAEVTAEAVTGAFGLGASVAADALKTLADEGALMRLSGGAQVRWMAPEVFTRVRNRSLAKARAAVEPVPPAALQQLVLERAGITARAEEAGAASAPAGSPGAQGSPGAPGAAGRSGAFGVGVAPGRGVEALAEAIAALEGVWLPAGLWESVVFTARVADYRPAMLDDLIGSGEVVWVCRTQDGVTPGEIAFFPSDSPLAPVAGAPVGAGEYDAEEQWALVGSGQLTADSFAPVRALLQPLPPAVPPRRVRSRRTRRYGGYRTGYLTGRTRPAGSAGAAQSTPPASGPLPPPDALRPSSALTAGGFSAGGSQTAADNPALAAALATASWRRLTPPQVTAEEQAVADVESLLDRYGVVSRDVALAAGIPGGITPLLPVLRRMEDTGVVLRGAFVAGLGPSQFADRETVDRLRALAGAGEAMGGVVPVAAEQPAAVGPAPSAGRSLEPLPGPASAAPSEPSVVLDLKDPACLVGGVVPWPEPVLPPELAARAADVADGELPRPAARQGARVVLIGGRPVLHAAERLRALTCYTTIRAELERALAAVVAAETRAALREALRTGKRVVEALNGVSALDPVVGDLLATAGLVRDPRGMRLHIDPYRS